MNEITNIEFILIAVFIALYLYSTLYYLKEVIEEWIEFEGKKTIYINIFYLIVSIFAFVPIFNTLIALKIYKYNLKQNRNAAREEKD